MGDRSATRILFLGNPGVGKSFLLNSLIQEKYFKSGVAEFNDSNTTEFQVYSDQSKLVDFIDTPGLCDASKRSYAVESVQKALNQGGYYRIFYVAVLQSGRLRPDDLDTVKMIADAIGDAFKYSLIINKLSKRMYTTLKDDMSEIKNFFASFPFDNVFLMESFADADDVQDHIVELPHSFHEFIMNQTPILLPTAEERKIKLDKLKDDYIRNINQMEAKMNIDKRKGGDVEAQANNLMSENSQAANRIKELHTEMETIDTKLQKEKSERQEIEKKIAIDQANEAETKALELQRKEQMNEIKRQRDAEKVEASRQTDGCICACFRQIWYSLLRCC
jgi:predicted GTPase